MVQKSHSQPPGMYIFYTRRKVVGQTTSTNLNWWETTGVHPINSSMVHDMTLDS